MQKSRARRHSPEVIYLTLRQPPLKEQRSDMTVAKNAVNALKPGTLLSVELLDEVVDRRGQGVDIVGILRAFPIIFP